MHKRRASVVCCSHALTSGFISCPGTGGSIIVKQIGHAVLTVNLTDGGKEEFLSTLPRLRIDGLWYGSPYIELTDMSYIQSSTGWLSTVRLTSLLSLYLMHSFPRPHRSSTRASDTSRASRTRSRRDCRRRGRSRRSTRSRARARTCERARRSGTSLALRKR